MGQEQRERAIDQIYGIFAAAGYGNIADLMATLDGFAAEDRGGRARYRPGDARSSSGP